MRLQLECQLQASEGLIGADGLTSRMAEDFSSYMNPPQGWLTMFITWQLASPWRNDPREESKRKPFFFFFFNDLVWGSPIILLPAHSSHLLSTAYVQGRRFRFCFLRERYQRVWGHKFKDTIGENDGRGVHFSSGSEFGIATVAVALFLELHLGHLAHLLKIECEYLK